MVKLPKVSVDGMGWYRDFTLMLCMYDYCIRKWLRWYGKPFAVTMMVMVLVSRVPHRAAGPWCGTTVGFHTTAPKARQPPAGVTLR